jgi:8-oxo-dGTP diphosphatase
MHPIIAVDTFIVRRDGTFVLIKRKNDPFKDHWAIPGGMVKYGEKVEDAAVREAMEETGLIVKLERIIGVYSDPQRDPRGHIISIAFLAKEVGGNLKASSDAKQVKSFCRIPKKIAFDHDKIIKDSLLTLKKRNHKR